MNADRLRVAGLRVATAARRDGPRLVRLVWHNGSGAVVAIAVAVWLSSSLLLHAALASPRWATGAVWLAELIRHRRVTVAGVVLLALAAVIGIDTALGQVLLVTGLAWAAIRIAMAVYPHTRRGRVRTRYGLDGWCGYWEHHRLLSAHAARVTAATMRHSIAATLPPPVETVDDVRAAGGVGAAAGQRARRLALVERLPVTECGTWLGMSRTGPVTGMSCFAGHRDTVGMIAAPGTGKTALIGHHVIDHCGAVIATSTKPDLFAVTAALRARYARSGRVEVFDPEGLTPSGSTFRWDPVRGCDKPAVAAERAAAFVGATSAAGGEDGSFWKDSGARVLRTLLMAAALGGRTMRDVGAWIASPAKAEDALELLEDTHRGRSPVGWADELRQVLHTDARRTRESIFLTLSQSVAFLSDPAIAQTVCPGADEPIFDVASFLADHGTLYLLGSEREHATIAPLLAVFVNDVFERAKAIAAHRPHGRLDPPLVLALDEAALIVPVPLDRWIADAGGRGIHLVWAVQSLSQLAQRWGERGAETIWNSTNAKLVFGGLTLARDVDIVSSLCGTRLELVPDPDDNGRARYERVPVVPPDRVRTIPAWHCLLLHRAAPPAITRFWPAWERHDVLKAGAAPIIAPIPDAVAVDDPATGPVPTLAGADAQERP